MSGRGWRRGIQAGDADERRYFQAKHAAESGAAMHEQIAHCMCLLHKRLAYRSGHHRRERTRQLIAAPCGRVPSEATQQHGARQGRSPGDNRRNGAEDAFHLRVADVSTNRTSRRAGKSGFGKATDHLGLPKQQCFKRKREAGGNDAYRGCTPRHVRSSFDRRAVDLPATVSTASCGSWTLPLRAHHSSSAVSVDLLVESLRYCMFGGLPDSGWIWRRNSLRGLEMGGAQ